MERGPGAFARHVSRSSPEPASLFGQSGRDAARAIRTEVEQGMRVLILGGGVIGTSLAYHLAMRGADVIVIEQSAIACAASGKSGGFLALDWCDGTPLMQLACRSFVLPGRRATLGPGGSRRTSRSTASSAPSTRQPRCNPPLSRPA